MPSITNSVNSLLGRGGNFEKLGKAVGVDKDKAELAVGAAAPEIVGGLAAKAQDRGGVKAVNAVIDGNDGSILDDLGGFFANKKSDDGAAMLDQVFGSDRSDLLESLVNKTGLSEGIIGKVLPLLAPIVMSVIGGKKADDDLDNEGVVTLLTNETADLEKDGFLSGSVAAKGVAATGAAAAATAIGAANKSTKKVSSKSSESVKGKAESMKDKAKGKAEAMKDQASAAKDKAGEVKDQAAAAKGKAADAKDQAGKAKGKAAEAVKGQASSAKGKAKAASAKGAAGTKKGAGAAKGRATAATDRVGATTKSTKVATTSNKKGGLGWIGYALGLLALVAVLALLASQCSSSDEETTADSSVDADASADLQGLVDAELPDGVSASIDGDVVTLTGDVASDADADAAVAAAEGVEGVGSVVNELTVTEADADADVEEDVDADDSADLQAALDAASALLPEGVSASVEGDVVTLTGEVASQADADAVVAAAEGVEGVGSVVNELTVAEADGDAEEDADADSDAATPLNDLGDITFNYNSAQLTAEGEAVVVKWAAYLEENADTNVQIVGHTDSDGPEDDNLSLSQRRADSVKASLEAKGIAADRMTTDGKGEASPKVENDSEANKAANRRIEFIEQ